MIRIGLVLFLRSGIRGSLDYDLTVKDIFLRRLCSFLARLSNYLLALKVVILQRVWGLTALNSFGCEEGWIWFSPTMQ